MLVEDHYGVGDTINAGVATGTVEAMTLLTTRLQTTGFTAITLRVTHNLIFTAWKGSV